MYYLIGIALFGLLWYANEARRKRKIFALRVELHGYVQQIARLVLSGQTKAAEMPYPAADYAPALRRVQLVADSCEIIERSKNRETRGSRLEFVAEVLDEMRVQDANELTESVFECAQERIAHATSTSACRDVLEPALKALKAAQRASRDQTIIKYLYEARDLVEAGMASQNIAAQEKQSIERLQSILASALDVVDDHVEMHLRISRALQ